MSDPIAGRREIEVKFRLDEDAAGEVRRRLSALGAQSQGERREIDLYLDTADRELAAGNRVLRLRSAPRPLSDGQAAVLTYKGPPSGDAVFSDREEIEVTVTDLEASKTIFERLGYRPWRRKEKLREPFVLDGLRAFMDRLPFLGPYLEIEGPREGIAHLAARLGLDLGSGSGRSYLELYREYWLARGLDPDQAPELLFANEDRRPGFG